MILTIVVAVVTTAIAIRLTGESPDETVVYAVGDGADGSATSARLARYVRGQDPDRFFYLGDVYETGTASEFAENYDPLYGSLTAITDPVIGNHEYGNRDTGYYAYWTRERQWTREQAKHRSYTDASGWQVIAYSSETDPASEAEWLAEQIGPGDGNCRIAIAHRGRHVVADAEHGDNPNQAPLWETLEGRTAINLVAHNHIYGRLAPIAGVHVIVSGAGGHGLRDLGAQHHPVAAATTGVATATRLVLRRGSADITQVDSTGRTLDSHRVTCTTG